MKLGRVNVTKYTNVCIILCVCFIVLAIIYYYTNIIKHIEPYTNTNANTKMKQTNVIFAGTCRDVEPYIEKLLKDIEKCGSKFNDYSVIIYENDSKDKTRKLLNKYKKNKYYYIFEDNVREKRRTKRLEHGRNMILEKTREMNKSNYYEYLIILDLDDANRNGTFVDTIDTCFDYDNWDVLTANQDGSYYDIWALRKTPDLNYDFNRHTPEPHEKSMFGLNYEKGQLLEVDSAFGGTAIYKLASIPDNCKYIGEYENGDEKCEHVDFNECIRKNGGKIFINTSFMNDGKIM